MINIKKLTDFEQFVDERGAITKLNNDTLHIFTKAGFSRANHRHLTNSGHSIVVTKGKIEYYERPTGSTDKPFKHVLEVGDEFIDTGALQDHTMYFPEDTVFYCFSYGSRKQGDYEKDIERFDYSLKDIYDNWKE